MLTSDDIIDAILRHLRGPGDKAGGAQQAPAGWGMPGPKGRLFLSEYDLKKRLTSGAQHLTIPKDAIISPLALDWLTLKGIKVVRQ